MAGLFGFYATLIAVLGYKGDKSAELARQVNKYMASRPADTLYLDLSALPRHRIDGLKTSLTLSGAAHVRVLESEQLSRQTVRILRADDARVVDIAPLAESPRGFMGEAKLRSGVERFVVRVVSKSREAIEGFFARLKELLGLTPGQHSVATAISRARIEMKQKFQLSEEEFDVQVGKEFGDLEIVTVPNTEGIDEGG